MTIRDAQKKLREIGIVLTYDSASREFRVNFKGGSEATAYYTNDLDDAVATAKSMRERQPQSSRTSAVNLHGNVAKYVRRLLAEGNIRSQILYKLKINFPLLYEGYLQEIADGVINETQRKEHPESSRHRFAAEEWEKWNNPKLKETIRALLDEGNSPAKVLHIITKTHKIEKMVAGKMIREILDEKRTVSGRFEVGQALDRISDHLEAMRQVIPREASNLRGIILRLDRVANTLDGSLRESSYWDDEEEESSWGEETPWDKEEKERGQREKSEMMADHIFSVDNDQGYYRVLMFHIGHGGSHEYHFVSPNFDTIEDAMEAREEIKEKWMNGEHIPVLRDNPYKSPIPSIREKPRKDTLK